MIVVASNDSFRFIRLFDLCTFALFKKKKLPVIRGLTRFLTVAEVTVVEDGVVIIDSVAIFFFLKRAKEANIIATRISLDVGFRELKNAL